ncbi:uncharacterized protein N7515_002481 [Penicillium bovifimosum]|uniref:Uncharacterized protein n=1 Tax=Penicillium bovifimosum TaxID=126998 RepID=A0A9W9HBS0_9EURO|nr:uncharacterized protein N7515_002481 [Penicillium bovifimosum]KAJ5143694.1 hypothetical protein N7515_002481 [Penicillium bovifimosum]
MARPQNKPTATAIKLPTLNSNPKSNPSLTRSVTSSTLPQQKEKENQPADSGNADDQVLECQHQIKATLTDILNDDRVKHNPDGSRCVQKALLDNEHDMRKQRRHSLNSTTKRQMML